MKEQFTNILPNTSTITDIGAEEHNKHRHKATTAIIFVP
jgi:hypothetical protein